MLFTRIFESTDWRGYTHTKHTYLFIYIYIYVYVYIYELVSIFVLVQQLQLVVQRESDDEQPRLRFSRLDDIF